MAKHLFKNINSIHACGHKMKPETLPEYTIRISPRSKRPALRVLPGPRLEVVIPKGVAEAFGQNIAEALTRTHERWIKKHCQNIAERLMRKHEQWIKKHCQRMDMGTPWQETGLPEKLLIRGGLKTILIRKLSLLPPVLANPPIRHRFKDRLHGINDDCLELPEMARNTAKEAASTETTALYIPDRFISDPQTTGSGHALLRHWVKAKAKLLFSDILEELSVKGEFSYTGPDVRINKSRWGSCSAKKNIVINACALFLPDELIRHIVLHELCHTREMNHQDGFWREMFRWAPGALQLEEQLRKGWQHVPGWMLH